LFALGLMAKPMLVTLPMVLLVLDYWPLRRFEPGRGLIPWRLVREKIPLLALSAVACVITLHTQAEARNPDRSPVQCLSNALDSYAVYVKQMFWPVRLAVHYPYPKAGWPPGELMAAGLGLAAVSAAVWAARRKQPWLPAGWLWYLGMLVPVIGLVPVGEQAHSDRYTYLPQIGLYIMLTWLMAERAGRRRDRRWALGGPALVALAGSTLYSVFLALSRRLRRTPGKVMVFLQLASLAVAGGATVPFAWTTPSLDGLALMATVGLIGFLGYILVNRALQLAPASVVAPFQYLSIIWSIALGYLTFGDVPSATTLGGAALIIAAGAVILLLERRAGQP